jgi:hypothetical protein
VEYSKSKIKLKPESLKKNMFLSITLKNGKVIEAYFKKFTFKHLGAADPKKANVYRDNLEDIFKEFSGINMD